MGKKKIRKQLEDRRAEGMPVSQMSINCEDFAAIGNCALTLNKRIEELRRTYLAQYEEIDRALPTNGYPPDEVLVEMLVGCQEIEQLRSVAAWLSTYLGAVPHVCPDDLETSEAPN